MKSLLTQDHPMRGLRNRAIFWYWVLISLPSLASAQVPILQGPDIPQNSLHADWYLDTVAHRVYHRQPDWKLVPSSHVFSLRSCGKYLLMTTIHITYVALENEEFVGAGTACECLDRLVRMRNENAYFFWGDAGYLGRALCGNDEPAEAIFLPTDRVGGVPAFCISATENKDSKIYLNDAHAWGMIDLKGKWLIEPKYDAPFHFENGVAEVIYYGQRRKINEKGEFVE